MRVLRGHQRLLLIPHSGGTRPPDAPVVTYATRLRSRSGIALLVTLVVLALLAVFLTEFTFETTLETRSLQNFQASFQARNAVKSLFKAVLVGLEGRPPNRKPLSEVEFFKQLRVFVDFVNDLTKGNYTVLNPPRPIGLPPELISYATPGLAESFPNAIFYTPYVRPIDHLFNLNRLNTVPGTPAEDKIREEFITLLEDEYQLAPTSSEQVFALLHDWIDEDEDRHPLGGNEQGFQDITFGVIAPKNAFFDDLQELLLVIGANLEDQETKNFEWEQHFTVHAVGVLGVSLAQNDSGSPRINVNLAEAEEIQKFIGRIRKSIEDVNGAKYKYVDQAQEIGGVLVPAKLPFDSREEYKNKSDISRKLESSPTTQGLPVVADEFFLYFSRWYDIRLKAEVDGVQAEVRAVVSVEREEDGMVKPNSLTIHEFTLR
ncbi:MAG: hypothetical protein VX420_07995 [SAR324 cluster bacterium]|nr:hypothetical protein [SAR324 cluster bacterium]MEE2717687.1 hypothetical protein [SAR324 cluster bacterium]